MNCAATVEWVLEAGGRVRQYYMLVLQDIPNSLSAVAVGGKASGSLWLLGVEQGSPFPL